MTKILWHGVAPWQPTGYGQQAAIWAARLRDAGHEVAISAQGGASSCAVTYWHGIPVYPSAIETEFVPTVSRYFVQHFNPDVVITCYDAWQMGPGEVFAGYDTIAWIPIDTSTVALPDGREVGQIAAGDRAWLQSSKARPVAMSQHGKYMLERAGYEDVPVIPHGIDTRRDWTPQQNRQEYRDALGLGPDTFAVGIMGTNIDPHRKSFAEQFIAFSAFHATHPDSVLFVHSTVHMPHSLFLDALAQEAGIPESAFRLSNVAIMGAGMFPQPDLRNWYSCMDVVLNCARGEGFGLAAIEAQACGTPVILTDAHTGPELAGPGFLVRSQPFWNWTHNGWWQAPLVEDITEALEKAHASAGQLRDASREFAEKFDTRVIWPLWEQLLGSL